MTACNSTTLSTPPDTSTTVVIQNQSFIPESITVDAGETVFFINNDSLTYQVLSQSADNQFDDTGDIDSGNLPSGAVTSITIDETASSGDVFYFYEFYLQDAMATPNGTITVN